MTLFDVARLLHVAAAILWVGGGISLAVGAELTRRRLGSAGMLAFVKAAALMGPGYFVPLSFLTLLTGGIAAWHGPGFTQLWVLLGLGGAAATFLIGLLAIKPRTEAIARLIAREPTNEDAIADRVTDLMTLVRLDHLVLLAIVAAMVLKPSPSDIGILLGLGSVLVLGFALVFVALLRRRSTGAITGQTQAGRRRDDMALARLARHDTPAGRSHTR